MLSRITDLPILLSAEQKPAGWSDLPTILTADECLFITNKEKIYFALRDAAIAYSREPKLDAHGIARLNRFIDKVLAFMNANDALLMDRFADICDFYVRESKAGLFKTPRILKYLREAIVSVSNRFYPFETRILMGEVTAHFSTRVALERNIGVPRQGIAGASVEECEAKLEVILGIANKFLNRKVIEPEFAPKVSMSTLKL